jgi:hypothetical protein
MNKLAILREFFDFLKQRKKMWLIPLAIFLIILGFFIFAAHGSVLAPFVYTLF